MTKKYFGSFENNDVNLFTLQNYYIKAELLDYGATLRSLIINGRDIICGFDDINAYLSDNSYQGAIIGRYANRIENGGFTLNGCEYILFKNEKGVTHLHGGKHGFDKRIWNAAVKSCGNSQSIEFSLFSPDGEEGYPGNLEVTVTYTLTEKNLLINYKAKCDKDTPLNLTNHSYFNLNGYNSGDIYSHVLKINSDMYSEVDKLLIPIKKASVLNTPFDFKTPKKIGQDINNKHPQLDICEGYDHNFYLKKDIIKDFGDKNLHEAAVLSVDDLSMNMYTDMPCIQLYTGNFLTGSQSFKKGVKQEKHHALCLETQYAPNSPHCGEAILKAGEIYNKTTAFIFE
ncbi:MAG: hypothetical protein A2Y15_06825 [Clostridiales bacterium GWF2_36_10]|nr:MAG: hypothetical protein A2Y15_06825 [Clostridiales bacterium GWF2_36_10]HAN20361.1 galactose-1-epimerase [Clostridiales bacterium]